MAPPQVTQLLKSDQLGRIERLESARGPLVRRLACGSRLPGSRWVARLLLARERRALDALEGMPGVAHLVTDESCAALPGPHGEAPTPGEALLRSWIEGVPLHRTDRLALDFFEHLEELVHELHRNGVCHNDLHKEQNVLVAADGYPWLIDFQLASRHKTLGVVARSRMRDDLRHVQKHKLRYTADGRGPKVAEGGAGATRPRMRRTPTAWFWRRAFKPVYVWVTRSLLHTRDGEERRPSCGPWPRWTPALGPRPDSRMPL